MGSGGGECWREPGRGWVTRNGGRRSMDSGPHDQGGRVASPKARGRHGSPTASPPARFKCPPGAYASPVNPGLFRFSA